MDTITIRASSPAAPSSQPEDQHCEHCRIRALKAQAWK